MSNAQTQLLVSNHERAHGPDSEVKVSFVVQSRYTLDSTLPDPSQEKVQPTSLLSHHQMLIERNRCGHRS